MAECSYARCLQERRFIKRELMKWYKDMLCVVGLERVAEEHMGRRKWKQFQEVLTRSHLSTDITNLYQIDIPSQKHEVEQKLEKLKENLHHQQQQPFENDLSKINAEAFDVSERTISSSRIQKENFEDSSIAAEGNIKLNNNSTASHSIHNNRKGKNKEEPLPPRSPTPPTPIDWTPNEKCNFCIDGKLLTVNEKGELVAESSPALSEADLANKPPGDTDSDSSESLDRPNARIKERKITASRLRDSFPSNMTSLESVAALTTIQSISGLSGFPLNSNILYNLNQHGNSATPTTSETSAAAISPSLKDSPSPSDLTGEQPLDLSSKPSPNSSIGGDAKHVNRAKPRVTPCAGRRTYTDEELTNALQDIMSGRLGTRRAAVQYNIPRSTLRNKVYKISSKAKHGAACNTMHHPASLDDLADADEDKQDLSADEEDNSGDKMLGSSFISHGNEELASHFPNPNFMANIQKIYADHKNYANLQHQQQMQNDIQIHSKPTTLLESHSKQKDTTPQPQPPQTQPPPPQTSPIAQNTAWQNILLQSLLFSRNIPLHQEAFKLLSALLMEHDPNFLNSQLLMQLQQQQHSPQTTQQSQQQQHQQVQHQQQQQQHLQANTSGHSSVIAANAATTFQNRQPKSETPETASSVDLNETLGDDPSVILKIPSYKPVAGSSTSSTSAAAVAVAAAAAAAASLCNSKNSENLPSTSPKIPTALGVSPVAHHHHHLHPHHNPTVPSTNNIPGMSPPLIRHTSDQSQSPPTLSLREVIASSISRTFQQANKDAASSPSPSSSLTMDSNDQYKRPSISVIKNIGGTDTSRFATAPNILSSHHNSNHHHQQHHHHQHHNQNAANNNLAGGKGTRPKRGKYRNYDRDSLVEAVKAVQRGEMSVHRAGSYYGVPHSTLEYKVKERHLMRPRKREPKPQPPLDDRTGSSTSGGGSSTSSTVNASKNSNIPGLSAVNSLDKLNKNSGTAGPSVNQKQCVAGKSNPPFPTTSQNGMKLAATLFEPSLAAQLSYPPHILWPGGFGPFSMDFNPRPVTAAASNASFSSAELFKSQVMQRFHEERGPPNAISSPPVSAAALNNSTNSNSTNHIKNVREITENFYDTSGANGSFLDGIIRKTLDRKSSDHALRDQLVKNSKPPPPRMMINNESATTTGGDLLRLKRSASPMHYNPVIDIKRERASPSSDSSNSDSDRNAPRDTDSEPLPAPPSSHPPLSSSALTTSSSHLALGLHHALLGSSGSSDLNGTPQAFTCQMPTPENNIRTASSTSESSSSALNTSILHEKLGQIKTETEDSL